MTAPNHPQLLSQAVQHYRAGQLVESEDLVRQVLEQNPNHPDALTLLGAIARTAGHIEPALQIFQAVVALQPGNPLAYNNLGTAIKDANQIDNAIAAFRKGIELRPEIPDLHSNLSDALRMRGLPHEAAAAARTALGLRSLFPEASLHLGNALSEIGQIDEAIAAFNQAIQLRPDLVEAYNSLGAALTKVRRYDEAIKAYETVIRLQPSHADAFTNMSLALKHLGKDDEAIEAARKAVELNDRSAEAHNNLGFALYDVGRLDEALAELRRAFEVDPNSPNAHSSYLFCLHFDPKQTPESILAAHLRWAQTLAPITTPTYPNDRSPNRKIKIGYISPDFREHPVGVFMMPALQHHNSGQFEVTCYNDTINPDQRTAILRAHADRWFDTAGRTHDQLAALIREHQIDILVDLALHSAGNRMLVFARKPAPRPNHLSRLPGHQRPHPDQLSHHRPFPRLRTAKLLHRKAPLSPALLLVL